MIWLAWRQFRASAASATAALVLLAAALALTGPGLAEEYATELAACASVEGGGGCSVPGQRFFRDHRTAFFAVTGLVLAMPALIGMFWGAPLVAREFEAGTHALVWSQSVTRTRWLATRLGLVGLAAVTVAGLGSLLVTWWSPPLDTAASTLSRMEPVLFAARGVVPVGYAVLALALGVAVGMLVRRLLPAMALTLAVLVAVQIAVPALVRPSLLPPVRSTIEISETNAAGFRVARVGPDRVTVDAGDTGAWLLSSRTVNASGRVVGTVDVPTSTGPCGRSPEAGPGECLAEMTRLGYRLQVTYHPASRFWPLQWIETGIHTLLALGLAGFCLWRVRRPS
ncbi:ABC transporter permease [Nocardiopsis halotolerans]|uniref:ABC transporter permease n=1 Tax=Nocardiopsis halotolerans TaxID=124252 RepID=UPI00034AF09D|nr:ABC transporter permease [Nocardiopsis halotolerans]